jgi:hypothetical protein
MEPRLFVALFAVIRIWLLFGRLIVRYGLRLCFK